MNNPVTEEFKEQLHSEFAKQCNYISNKALQKNLDKFAQTVYDVSNEMSVDVATYIKAVRRYAPVLKGQTSLTPGQLVSKDVKNYIADFVRLEQGSTHESYFNTLCSLYARYLENGWPERLCLANETFNFPAWFRILMRSERDEELIKKFGDEAANVLNRDLQLTLFLRTVTADDGSGLDFGRIPKFKQ